MSLRRLPELHGAPRIHVLADLADRAGVSKVEAHVFLKGADQRLPAVTLYALLHAFERVRARTPAQAPRAPGRPA